MNIENFKFYILMNNLDLCFAGTLFEEQYLAPGYEKYYTFSQGVSLYGVRRDGKWGFLRGDDVIIPCSFDSIEFASGFACVVKRKGKCGLLDAKKEALSLPCVYDKIEPVSYTDDCDVFIASLRGLSFLTDVSGKRISPASFDLRHEFDDIYSTRDEDGKVRYYRLEGRSVADIGVEYEKAHYFDRKNSVCAVFGGTRWGFINKDFQVVNSFIYDEVGEFFQGLAMVKRRGMWGYVDGATGKESISCQFQAAGNFNAMGCAAICKGGQMLVIDRFGKDYPLYSRRW